MENIEGGPIPAEAAAPVAPIEPVGAAETVEATDEPARRAGLIDILNSRTALLVAGALLIGGVFWYLQFSTGSLCCGDYDAYYHFRWSRMLWEGMRTGHFPPSFDALPLTTLNPKDYVDHHFLFHVLQIPFTFFSDFQTGAKIGTWLFAGLAVFSCYWLLVRNRLSYPLVWLVAIIGSSAPFLYRMNMGKAMSVSIVLLVVGVHLLFERRYRWLLPLAFVFALTYDMVFLLSGGTFLWFVVTLWEAAFLQPRGGVALCLPRHRLCRHSPRLRHQPLLPTQPPTALRAPHHQGDAQRLHDDGRVGVVSVQHLGVLG